MPASRATIALALPALALALLGSADGALARRTHRRPPPVAHPRPACEASRGCRELVLTAVGAPALSDASAARLVHRVGWEPRPDNAAANAHAMSALELAYFRSHSTMPYRDRVTGHYRGTTDEIIQWAAHKHGLSVDLLRAVAVVESWWHMSTRGDNGDSFGLYQIRRPYHCCPAFAAHSTAFNADYYGAIIRSYYDGTQGWLNTVSGNTRSYAAGDLWGSVGAWASGRWHDARAESYVASVKSALSKRTWESADFAHG
ncbi:MAG TPA: hypothetical protein VGN69_05320 [Solirubrobacteraceae bacterium]|jgi:hypothetical protein|nr:hypothetical protein [Solirubrobacteraceae bacterium]